MVLDMRGKLLLFGDHAVVYGRPCLVAAIDRLVSAKLVKKIGRESTFVAAARKLFEQKYGLVEDGFKIRGFPSCYGLGSSAAVTAAVAQAMFKLKKIKVSQKELFDFCYQVVQQVQGVGSGFDLAAAIYGGVIYFVTGGKKIEKLRVKELPLVVGYSGVKADTASMIKQAAGKIDESFLNQSAELVEQGKTAIIRSDWQLTGRLMDQNQKLLKQLGVSTPKLDTMIDAAIKAGAWGAKLSGAGGGDCMITFAAPSRRQAVEQAIQSAGGEIIRGKLAS